MRNGSSLLLLFWLVAPLLAGNLTGKIRQPAPNVFEISAEINDEGTYQLQRANSLPVAPGGWSSLAPFHALPGLTVLTDPVNASRRFYRLVRLTDPPLWVTQPAGTTNFSGQQIRLEGTSLGSWPLRYQWFRDGQPIASATSNSLTFAAATTLSGAYQLRVTSPWGTIQSAPVNVQVQAPVALRLGGKKIRYTIRFAQGGFLGAGTFETQYDPSGFYNTVGSSVFLNDSGYWQYSIATEHSGRIDMPASITYPDGITLLTFQSLTNGTYTLTVPGRAGGQGGDFHFLN